MLVVLNSIPLAFTILMVGLPAAGSVSAALGQARSDQSRSRARGTGIFLHQTGRDLPPEELHEMELGGQEVLVTLPEKRFFEKADASDWEDAESARVVARILGAQEERRAV
jgi:hypothetical protein